MSVHLYCSFRARVLLSIFNQYLTWLISILDFGSRIWILQNEYCSSCSIIYPVFFWDFSKTEIFLCPIPKTFVDFPNFSTNFHFPLIIIFDQGYGSMRWHEFENWSVSSELEKNLSMYMFIDALSSSLLCPFPHSFSKVFLLKLQ